MNELERARSALASINSSCSRDEWLQIGMGAKAAGLSFDDFHAWSKNTENYSGEKDCCAAWKSFDKAGGVTEATLFLRQSRLDGKIPVTETLVLSSATKVPIARIIMLY